jgi:hypothetical protein
LCICLRYIILLSFTAIWFIYIVYHHDFTLYLLRLLYSVGPHIRHPKKWKDLKSKFFPGDFLRWHFPTLVMFKTGALWFFDSPPCASGATVDSLLTASRRQLACLFVDGISCGLLHIF